MGPSFSESSCHGDLLLLRWLWHELNPYLFHQGRPRYTMSYHTIPYKRKCHTIPYKTYVILYYIPPGLQGRPRYTMSYHTIPHETKPYHTICMSHQGRPTIMGPLIRPTKRAACSTIKSDRHYILDIVQDYRLQQANPGPCSKNVIAIIKGIFEKWYLWT